MPKKFCCKCKCYLSENNSTPAVFNRGWGYCRDCSRKMERMRYERNPSKKKAAVASWQKKNQDKIRVYRKRYKRPEGSWRRWTYGVTKDEFEAKLLSQNGHCAICGKVMVRPCQDHNHETGKNRDLLCVDCNHLIGQAHEDIKVLASAIRYLQKHSIDSSIQVDMGAGISGLNPGFP